MFSIDSVGVKLSLIFILNIIINQRLNYVFIVFVQSFVGIVTNRPGLGASLAPVLPLQTQGLHVIFAARSTITFCPSQQRSIWLRLMTFVVDINYVSLVAQNPSSFCHLRRYGNGFILSVPPVFVRRETLRSWIDHPHFVVESVFFKILVIHGSEIPSVHVGTFLALFLASNNLFFN